MVRPTEADGVSPPASPPEPLQRWRLVFAREPVASDAVGRVAMDAWGEALAASGLPLAGLEPGGPGRARFVIGAPLAASCAGLAELADIWLLDRVPAWAVREGLQGRMPPGHRWVGVENVWLGAPPLPGQVAAADWVVVLRGGPSTDELATGVRVLLEARALPRVRARGGADRPYDLRPLLVDAAVVMATAGPPTLRVTTRLDPALGSGRPEEVVAALGEAVGLPLDPISIVRERLVLADPKRTPAPERPLGSGRRRRP